MVTMGKPSAMSCGIFNFSAILDFTEKYNMSFPIEKWIKKAF